MIEDGCIRAGKYLCETCKHNHGDDDLRCYHPNLYIDPPKNTFYEPKSSNDMDKYEKLRDQVVWAVTHYGVVNTDGIIRELKETVIELDLADKK